MTDFPPFTTIEGCLPNAVSSDVDAAEIDKILLHLRSLVLSSKRTLEKAIDEDELSSQIEVMIGCKNSISEQGLGTETALNLFSSLLIKQGIPTNHPGYLAYVGVSPTPASVLMDGLLSASGLIGSAWLGGAGLIWAENQALNWLADLAGLPEQAGGCFVSGGTAGNLSALAAARARFRKARPQARESLLLVGESSHASIHNCACLLDLSVITIPCDENDCMTSSALLSVLQELSSAGRLDNIVAIVASAGSTNTGQIDDLKGVGRLAKAHEIWFHVDAAYGGAFLCVPEIKPLFEGIELADSMIVDPHKGLFSPYDCCALLYAEPKHVKGAFSQDAVYLDPVNASAEWNPMHYAFHLSRRARGVPLWFSLVVYGSHAYTQSLRKILALTQHFKKKIAEHENLHLINHTNLSVILFQRPGWREEQYYAWSEDCLEQGIVFVTPTKWKKETVLRLCIMTTAVEEQRIEAMLESFMSYDYA